MFAAAYQVGQINAICVVVFAFFLHLKKFAFFRPLPSVDEPGEVEHRGVESRSIATQLDRLLNLGVESCDRSRSITIQPAG